MTKANKRGRPTAEQTDRKSFDDISLIEERIAVNTLILRHILAMTMDSSIKEHLVKVQANICREAVVELDTRWAGATYGGKRLF